MSNMPAGDILGVRWRQIVAEDFLRPVAPGAWPGPYAPAWFTYPLGWPDNSKHGEYNPVVISVHDSCLDYGLRQPATGPAQIACVVPTLPGGAAQKGQLYSRHAFRFKADVVPGFHLVPLLWPDSETWPRDGEIDWPEADLTGPMYGFVHLQGAASANDQIVVPTAMPIGGGWHEAEVIWTPGGVKLSMDGVQVANYTGEGIPDTPMHLCLQAQTSNSGPAPTSGALAHILFDWVVVYAFVP